eukprot:1433296-Rhodomonas_salina.1
MSSEEEGPSKTPEKVEEVDPTLEVEKSGSEAEQTPVVSSAEPAKAEALSDAVVSPEATEENLKPEEDSSTVVENAQDASETPE